VIQQHSICNNTFCLATSNDVDEAISTLHSRTYEYMTGGGGGGGRVGELACAEFTMYIKRRNA
jgi:hypothetical protein